MKTPRELLLARHAAVEPKLDALRRHVIAEHVVPVVPPDGEPCPSRLRGIWRELFWPSRRVWASLAAAWLVIVALNVATTRGAARPRVSRAPASAGQELHWVLGEQARLRAEVLGFDQAPRPASGGSEKLLGPRSERTETPGQSPA